VLSGYGSGRGTSLRWLLHLNKGKYRDRKGIAALAANKTQKVTKARSAGKCESRKVAGESRRSEAWESRKSRSRAAKGMSTLAPQQGERKGTLKAFER